MSKEERRDRRGADAEAPVSILGLKNIKPLTAPPPDSSPSRARVGEPPGARGPSPDLLPVPLAPVECPKCGTRDPGKLTATEIAASWTCAACRCYAMWSQERREWEVVSPVPVPTPGLKCPWCGEPMPPGTYTGERRSCPSKGCARLSKWRGGRIGWDASGSSRRPADMEPAAGQGTALALEDPEPWPEPVDGAALLDELSATARRYVAMPPEAADAAALWVEHAAAHDAADVSPILAITSAERRSGKSTLRRVIGALVPRPLAAANVSAPALYRVIESGRPTLLMDEADTWLLPHRGESEATAALRGVANSGHTRDEVVLRCEGDRQEVRAYSTWAPKVLVLIGDPPDTLADRSTPIRLRRRKATEDVERLTRPALAALEPLRRRAWTWAQAHMKDLQDSDPALPPGLDDRAADNWRPLLAIADLARGEWPARARRAAVALSAGRAEEETAGVTLLGDLRAIFDRGGADRMATGDLLIILLDLEDRPWASWGRDHRGLTRDALARLLKPFAIRPRKSGDFRGYDRLDLGDAWARYLPPPSTAFNPPSRPNRDGEAGRVALDPTPPTGEPARPADSEKDRRTGQTPLVGGKAP